MTLSLAIADDEDVPEPTPETVSGEVMLQPSVRVLTTWTPTQVRQAETSADSGYMAPAAELVDMLLADDRINGAIETRTGGLQGLPLNFEDGRGDESGDSPSASDLTDDWWQMYPESELKQLSAWGIVLGVGFAQQVWRLDDVSGRFRPHLENWHAKHFSWNHQIQRWQGRDTNGLLFTIEPNDARWVVYTPYGCTRPWSRGLWRGLGRWWMLKQYAISDWGYHGEQAARTVVTHEGDRSVTKDVRAELSADLYKLGKDGIVVLPTGFKYDLVESKADSKKLYGAQVDAANDAFVITVNGQNLTTSVEGGSLAAANVHERVEARRLRSDGETLSTTLRDQSIVWWTLWNFGQFAVAPWPRWATDPPEDLENKAGVLDMAADAMVKLKTAGVEIVDLDEFSKDYGLPELRKVESSGDDGTGGDDAVKGNPGDGGASGGDPGDGGDGSGSPGSGDGGGSGGEPAAKATFAARLASGLPLAQASGFVDGQSYADAQADWGARLQAAINRGPDGFVARLNAAIDGGASYSEIRELVLEVYRDEAPPEEAAAMIESLFIMANRAGQVAVDQDG